MSNGPPKKTDSLPAVAAAVIHQIRDPLSIILHDARNIFELSQAQALTSQTVGIMSARIVDHTIRISNLIHEIRSLFPPENSERRETTKVADLIEDAQIHSRLRQESENIPFTVKGNIELTIFVNPLQISQVLINLLNNAVESLLSVDRPKLEIQVYEHHKEIRMEIADNGPGIQPECAEKIFEPFFSTKKQSEGTGIGLFLCSEIMKRHGGTISLKKEKKSGASFLLCFPRGDK